MANDQLLSDCIDHFFQSKSILFLSYSRIKNNMKQQVTQFFFDSWPIFISYGVGQFISLFDSHVAKGFNRLLLIPGTFLTKFIHDRHQAQKRFAQIWHITSLKLKDG